MIESVNRLSSSGAISEGGLNSALRSTGGAAVSTSFAWARASSIRISLLEQLSSADQRFRQRLDFLERIVERKRRPASGGHSELLQQRHRAMRACPDRDSRSVDQGRDVMGMRPFHRKRDNRAFAFRRADYAQRITRGQELVRMSAQSLLMGADARAPDPLDIVERGPEPDRLHDRWRTGFEPMRRMIVGDRLPRDFLDHLAAALVGRQSLEKLAPAVEHADSRRAVNLVPGENVEVDTEIAHVDIEVHRSLRTIDEHRNAPLVGDFDDLLDRGRGPEDVRHLRYRDDFRSTAQRPLERLERKRAVVAHVDPAQNRAPAFTMEMPGHDVGVMLHHAQHNLVAGADVREAKARRNEIDRLGRRSRENDLLVRSRVDKPPHGLSGGLICLSRRIGEIMQAPMHVRILVLISVRQPVDDLLRLLGRGRVVQIRERLAIGSLREDRKVRPYRFNVVSLEHWLREIVHVFRTPSQTASRARKGSINSSSSTRSIDSPPKALSSIALASSLETPRDCK